MTQAGFTVERQIVICAERSTAFRFLSESPLFAQWWGSGSSIDPRPGGEVFIRYPNAVVARGEVVELVPQQRLAFTYGYEDDTRSIPIGGSQVTIVLEDRAEGTLLSLVHEVPDASTRDAHVPGWRYQLAVFANVVCNQQHMALDETADRYFAAWAEPDGTKRQVALRGCVTEGVEFRDPFGCVAGLEELNAHIEAARLHMPGVVLRRQGSARQCQGTALIDWVAQGPQGALVGQGTNVVVLAPNGKMSRISGIWSR